MLLADGIVVFKLQEFSLACNFYFFSFLMLCQFVWVPVIYISRFGVNVEINDDRHDHTVGSPISMICGYIVVFQLGFVRRFEAGVRLENGRYEFAVWYCAV